MRRKRIKRQTAIAFLVLLLGSCGTPPSPRVRRPAALTPAAAEVYAAVGSLPPLAAVPAPLSRPGIPTIQTWPRVNVEELAVLGVTDVVFQEDTLAPDQRGALERAGFRMVPLRLRRVEDVGRSMDCLSRLYGGAETPGEAFLRRWESAARRGRRMPRRRALIAVGENPFVVAGAGTFQEQWLQALGYENAGARWGRGWPSVGPERLALGRVDVLLLPPTASADAWLRFWPDARVVHPQWDRLMRPSPGLLSSLEDALERRESGEWP